MSQVKLGQNDESPQVPNGFRDAVHTPVIWAMAVESLNPGQGVRVFANSSGVVCARASYKAETGCVVDPFEPSIIKRWQSFWVLVRPGEASMIRHIWNHPDIPSEEELNKSVNPGPHSESVVDLDDDDDQDWCGKTCN